MTDKARKPETAQMEIAYILLEYAIWKMLLNKYTRAGLINFRNSTIGLCPPMFRTSVRLCAVIPEK